MYVCMSMSVCLSVTLLKCVAWLLMRCVVMHELVQVSDTLVMEMVLIVCM